MYDWLVYHINQINNHLVLSTLGILRNPPRMSIHDLNKLITNVVRLYWETINWILCSRNVHTFNDFLHGHQSIVILFDGSITIHDCCDQCGVPQGSKVYPLLKLNNNRKITIEICNVSWINHLLCFNSVRHGVLLLKLNIKYYGFVFQQINKTIHFSLYYVSRGRKGFWVNVYR